MLSPAIDRADRARAAVGDVSALTMADIADLSDASMSHLTREELVQLIDVATAQARPSVRMAAHRLQLRDTETLRRLAHLARFACRNLIRCQSRTRAS